MGTYMGHEGPVLSCLWSPLNSQLIMTGSSDFTLHVWNYTLSAQSPKQLSDIKADKKKNKQKKSPKNKTNVLNDCENNMTTPNSVSQSTEVTISSKYFFFIYNRHDTRDNDIDNNQDF